MSEATRIVAIVRNGKVTGVYSDDPDALCEVIDCDELVAEGAAEDLDGHLKDEVDGLTRVWEQP